MFYVNHRIEPFDITEVRQALNMVFDRQSFIDYAADGWGKIPIMLERDEAFTDIADGMEWPYLVNPTTEEPYTQQERIDLANAALDAIPLMSATPDPIPAGWVRTYDGTPLSFDIWSGDWQEHINVAQLAAEQLEDVGISLNHTTMTTKALVGATFRQTSVDTLDDWDTYIWGRAFSPEYDYFADQWGHHADADGGEGFAFTKRSCVYGWYSDEAKDIGDDLNELQTYLEGNATRDALIESTQLAWRDELPAIPIYCNINAGVYRSDRFSGWTTDKSYIAYGAIPAMASVMNIQNLVPLSYD
jgi:ABC-type transport system substrate-binding protein